MTGGKPEVRKRAGESSSGKIVKRVWIRASRSVVYSALTQSRELVNWFCDRASCDPREGGELVAYWRSAGQKGRAVITRMVPESALELVWVDDTKGVQEENKHTLAYEIHSKSGLTELVMTDKDDSAPDQDAIATLDQGWNLVLTELRDYCEGKERSAKLRPRSQSGMRNPKAE